MSWEFNQLQEDIWKKKYQYEDETFEEWLDRVSNRDEDIKELIKDKKFLFGGRILANRGLDKRGKKITLSNCYVLAPPEDSIEGIYKTCSELARTFSYGGGVGIDISQLRPKGAKVNNSAKTTTGAVSFMDTFSQVAGTIGQSGRRGALMLSMDVGHPDIEEFIDIKTDLDKVTKANISVRINDDFMKAVENNELYTCRFYIKENDETIEKEIKARELFLKLVKNNWDYAEPGILYWDRINNYNLLQYDDDFQYAGVNPCLVGDTLIQTVEGQIPIKDLVGQTPYVYCMDGDGKLIIKQAVKVWKTRENAELVKINHHRGELICTPDHLIYTRNRGWVKAKDLKPKDRLNGLGRSMRNEDYCVVKLSSDSKYHKEHRFIMNAFYDITNKDVHHINENKLDNRLSNLQVLSHGEHSVVTNIGHKSYCNRDEFNGQFIEGRTRLTDKINGQVNKQQTGKNFIVKNIEILDCTEDVYDMTVEDVHNFIANDIVVHNCAEEPLPAGGSCLLSAFNLSEYVINGKFDFAQFEKDIPKVVKAMNEVLDEGLPLHPLEIQRKTVYEYRQIGIGVMGIADMLIKLGLTYGDTESLSLCDEIGFTLANESIRASSLLAKEFGVYDKYNKDAITKSDFFKENTNDDVKRLVNKYGLRNSQLLTIAPTGTISTMLGVSGGIEPIFELSYTRKTESLHDKDVYYKVYTKIVKDYMQEHNLTNEIQLPSYFVTSSTINPLNRIKMQSIWQEHIDASISSTVNLPISATIDDVYNLYMNAWKYRLKGLTIYRNGCKREGILTTDKDKPKDTPISTWLPIPEDTMYYRKKIHTGCGKLVLFVGYSKSEDRLTDFYVKRSAEGGCVHNIDALVISMSGMIRLGGDLSNIEKAFKGCGACNSFIRARANGKNLSKGKSCPTAILSAIKEIQESIKNEKTESLEEIKIGNKCPECGEEIQMSGGCVICPSCGYSKCN